MPFPPDFWALFLQASLTAFGGKCQPIFLALTTCVYQLRGRPGSSRRSYGELTSQNGSLAWGV